MGLISRVSSRTYRSPNMFRQVVRTARRAASESASGMSFSFASARQDLYSNASGINQVDLPTGTGMMGILPNHVPTLGVLAAGWATVYEASGQKRFFVSSGSYTVTADGALSIAAEEATPESEKNDVQIATETLEAMLR